MWQNANDLMGLAMGESGRCLRKLRFNFTEPVDVFKIITDMGLVLMFRPLESEAEGFYIPPTSSRSRAGILINSRRPLTRQRYSAAHELCHFIKKDSARIEFVSEECVTLSRKKTDEAFADFFAGHFLMPPKLMAYFFKKLGFNKEDVSYENAYQLSLCMRTSYEATCRQLYHLGYVTKEQFQIMALVSPKSIKDKWAKGMGKKDIWPINYCMKNFILMPSVEDKVEVRLSEIPSSGYIWEVDDQENELLKYENSILQFGELNSLPGQTGERIFNFSVQSHGSGNLQIILRRPWEQRNQSVDSFCVRINSMEREFVGDYEIKQDLLAA